MKLKTLLLGSAAAMIAVTGVRAADAVIVEPEPVEYVRVCDLYGPGFYYIPGTETCLDIGGYVRVDYTYADPDVGQSSSRWDYRARVDIDARNETDYGTLRSQIRLQADGNGGSNVQGLNFQNFATRGTGDDRLGDGPVAIDRALISLGGLRFGYSDSFTTTHHGYGLPVEKYDGNYGYDQALFLDYTFAVAGFSITAGLQDSDGTSPGGVNTVNFTTGAVTNAPNPHVNLDYYVGTGYSTDLFSVAVSYIYEDVADNGALKVSGSVTPFDGLAISGFYVTDSLGDSGGNTRSVEGAGDYAWGVGASYQFIDTMALRGGYTARDSEDNDYFVVGLNWTPVTGLAVRPEVQIFEDGDGQEYSLRVYRTF